MIELADSRAWSANSILRCTELVREMHNVDCPVPCDFPVKSGSRIYLINVGIRLLMCSGKLCCVLDFGDFCSQKCSFGVGKYDCVLSHTVLCSTYTITLFCLPCSTLQHPTVCLIVSCVCLQFHVVFTVSVQDCSILVCVYLYIFSDDNQLYISANFSQLQELIGASQSCISDAEAWMRSGKLQLNPDKT